MQSFDDHKEQIKRSFRRQPQRERREKKNSLKDGTKNEARKRSKKNNFLIFLWNQIGIFILEHIFFSLFPNAKWVEKNGNS